MLSFVLKAYFGSRISPFCGWDLVTNVTPITSMKLAMFSTSKTVATKSNNSTFDTWDDLMTTFLRNLPITSTQQLPTIPRSTFSAQIVYRGIQGQDFWRRSKALQTRCNSKLAMPSSTHTEITTRTSYLYATDINAKEQRSIDACYNSTDCIPILTHIHDQALRKYEAGAYLHWYGKYAGEYTQTLFGDAFESLRSVIDGYETF